MVSLMCRWRKCTLRENLITALPLPPSTGKSRSTTTLENDIRYVCGFSDGGGRLQLISISHTHANAMLNIPVDRQQPHHQVRATVRTLNSQTLMGPVSESLPYDPLLVSRLQMGTYHTVGATEDPNRLPGVFRIPTL